MIIFRASNMSRTRLFIGMSSVLYGLAALLFVEGGVHKLMDKGTWEDWTWPISLVFCGGLMFFAAFRELAGERRRRCREISAFLLGCVWIAVFFESLADGKPDPLTLQSPLFVFFCMWAWLQDAHNARQNAQQKTLETVRS